MKKAICISCSDHYDHRLYIATHCLRARGYDVSYITSDFDHTTKAKFTCKVENCIQLPARPYQRNFSLSRILSHRGFARDVFRYLESLPEQPDVLVVLLPPNFLTYYSAKYKKRHPNVKLIFEIFDMWPETFPGKLKKLLLPVFWAWAGVRDRSLAKADFIVTECELFRQNLGLSDEKSQTVFQSAPPLEIPVPPASLSSDKIELCYLGAINNIISIPDIAGLLKQLTSQKPVVLHIIGKGEREEEFVEAAKATGAEVIFYGAVYDDRQKLDIMNRCHFGLNIMKPSVCVGLTMKSVDYFRFQLPIINNIPADTQCLVEKEGIGLQLTPDCTQRLLAMTNQECLAMRQQVAKVFAEKFERSVIAQQYDEILDRIGIQP